MHFASRTNRLPVPEPDVADTRAETVGNGAEESDVDFEQDTSTDAELLDQFVGTRDAAAFTAIVERYQRLVMGVALRQVGDRDRAEDVFQATFLVLAERARRIRRPEALPAWLHGTARRIGLAALRESRKHPAMNDTDQLDGSDPVLQQMQSAWERQVLDEELAALPERLRVPLVLHYLEGLTGRQVAERLGLSVDAVEGRLKKGRKELRQRLVKQGVGFATVLAAFQMSQQIAAAGTTPLVEATAASSVAWATQQPLEGCTANAARLAGKDIAAMTAVKTTTILTCTAIVCLGTGLIGSWALGAGDGSGAVPGAAPAAQESAETTLQEQPAAPAIELTLLDPPGQTPDGVPLTFANAVRVNEGLSSYETRSASRLLIEDKLDSELFEEELLDTQLQEFAMLLEVNFEFPVRIDEANLSEEGISVDTPLNWTPARGVTLRDALELILENVDGSQLDYIIDNGVLKITTAVMAEEYLETVIYELRHLYPTHQAEDISELIMEMTSGPWMDIDGAGGTIVELPGAVAVRQTQAVHREISSLLDQVEQFAARTDLPQVERKPKPQMGEEGFGSGSALGGSGGGGFGGGGFGGASGR